MSKVIIGIHGLGNKPAKDVLEKWWVLSMKEGLKNIGKQQHIPKFEMVYWADLFYEAPLDERVGDKEDPRFLDEPYRIAPASANVSVSKTKLKVLDYLGDKLNKLFLNPDLTLKHSIISEVVVDKFFHELGEYFSVNDVNQNQKQTNVRDKIISRVIQTLNKYVGDEIFLVCHSMGTIIAFDALSHVLKQPGINILATIGSPLGMPNVKSELAELQRRMELDKVAMQAPASVTKSWLNFSDPDDKVCFNYKLADDFEPNDLGIGPIDFLIYNNYIINGERNPHKSFGYLRAPEFANVLAQFLESKQSFRERVKGLYRKILSIIKK